MPQQKSVPGPERDFIGYGRYPPKVFWPEEARVAVSIVVNYEEGSEYSLVDGDGRNEGFGEIPYAMSSEYRDLSQESVYEYGSRVGIWRIFRILDEFQVPATIHACALAIERNPAVAEEIRESGHEACSHGYRWDEHWLFTREEERERIRMAVDSIREMVGERPVGWYCRYGPSVNTRELLVEEGGFVYDSDAYNDELPYFVKVNGHRHLVVPYTHSYNDSRFILSQGYSTPNDYFENLKSGFDVLWQEGEQYPKMLSIGLHPRWIGQASRSTALRNFIDYARERGSVWFTRRVDIANWWIEHHDEFKS